MLGLANGLEYPNLMASGAIIDVVRWGHIQGLGDATFSTARETGASATNTPTGTGSTSLTIYEFSSGRGSGSHIMHRLYMYFPTSGISGITSGVLKFTENSNGTGSIRIIKSTAFGGNGGSVLDTADFFDEIDYTTVYSNISGGSPGEREATLSSDAISDINNNDHFTLAMVEKDHDAANTAATSSLSRWMKVDWDETPQLVLT